MNSGEGAPLGAAELVAFVSTADAPRAQRFYEETLGLELAESTSFALVFRAPNATLRVTVVERVIRAGYTVLGWRVDDISEVLGRLVSGGVEPLRYGGLEQDEYGVWRSPSGARVAWFEDPDGNVLSITQP
jgi:catechol 2,3-dioxygenase-like lactoylglutathione lyase family enzyme